MAAVLLVAGTGAVTFLLATEDDEAAAPAPTEPPTDPEGAAPGVAQQPEPTTTAPDAPVVGRPELEAVVAELSGYVEQVRGAPFSSPVEVELLDGDAFDERVLADYEEEREDMDLGGRLLVAMRLLEPDQDLFELYGDFLGEGVLGFYDFEIGELVVRGSSVTAFTRSTIVHELTHAHDDQRFELDRPAVREAADESGFAFLALMEGNAVRVQQQWEATLSEDERDELLTEQIAAAGGLDVSDLPFVLLRQIEFPYTAGALLVEALDEAGGEARIDEAFIAPPVTSEQVIEPERYLDGEGPIPVARPPADGEVVDGGAFGQLTLRLTLSDVLDRETAREAADGWGGDAYTAWAEGERTCVRIAFVMDTPEDLAELVDGWRAWAVERPGATVAPGEGDVTVTSCA